LKLQVNRVKEPVSKSHYHTEMINSEIRIVVVEDEAVLLNNISNYLQLKGFKTTMFSSPVEAFIHLKKYPADAIVSDVKMPGMSGFELLEKVRKGGINQDAVFIFLTAKVEREDMRQGMNLEADDYITKPFLMQDLVHSIKTRLKLTADRLKENASKSVLLQTGIREQLTKLTKSEIKVIYLVSLGKTNEEIAEILVVSPRTIDNHRTNISNKLNFSGRNKLIIWCVENKSLIKSYLENN
jgi:DNA-binding NarL/FixJ family response regulator